MDAQNNVLFLACFLIDDDDDEDDDDDDDNNDDDGDGNDNIYYNYDVVTGIYCNKLHSDRGTPTKSSAKWKVNVKPPICLLTMWLASLM